MSDRPGWFAQCASCDLGFSVYSLNRITPGDPDEAEWAMTCPYCGEFVTGWNES